MRQKPFPKITRVFGIFAIVAVFAIIAVPQVIRAQEIPDPEPFVWTYVSSPEPHYVGVLEYGQATFNINGYTLTTRAYRQEGHAFSVPGPTIHMMPGNKYVLRFRNLLDYEPLSPDHNVFKDPNVTNVHTHGLHISPGSPSDDVTRWFEGGYGGDYVYDIPEDHMGGTFWYHAHHHGSTFLQVSSGGFGLIIIDDSLDGIPANVAAMEERQIVIGYLDPSVAGTGGDTLVSGTLPGGWTVNGKVYGDITVPSDTWLRFRVLLADADARVKDVTFGPNAEVKLLARDGVWRTVAPKDLASGTIGLTGASRAELAVRFSGNSAITVARTTVANIVVAGTPNNPTAHPYAADGVSTWSATRPAYLRDLRNEAPHNTESISMGARTVNGSKWDPNVPTFTLNADGMQEWGVSGATNHPFHLHVYHFQLVSNSSGDFENGEYYDTLATGGTVRFDMDALNGTAYDGRTIMHCHMLDHEDQGAMTWMDVVGGLAPPSFPSGLGYSAYYMLQVSAPLAPSNLSATTVSSSAIDLAWADNSNNEASFNIERSLDGVNFSPLASVGADSVSYRDAGLTASTTYWYRVNAENSGGASAWSNDASATTLQGTQPTAVVPESVVVTTVNIGGGNKTGQATVTVVDDLGGHVEGATVTGDFTGTINEPNISGVTDATGTVVLTTSGSAKGSVLLTFCVKSITHPALTGWTGSFCASN